MSAEAKIGILMRCYLPFLWTIGACTTPNQASRIVAILGAVVSSVTLCAAIIRAIEEKKS